MDYIVIDQLKKVIAWTNKCGGSSVRRQIMLDLDDPILKQRWVSENPYTILADVFKFNPIHQGLIKRSQIPSDYIFEWYVRDPFFRLLSCYLNRLLLIEQNLDVNFRDFVFNLQYYRNKSDNITNHTNLQVAKYFEAPWNVIDIKKAKFSFSKKMNSTKYNLGYKENAWNIIGKDIVVMNGAYSPESFYSKEIVDAIKILYRDDYAFLQSHNIEVID